MTDQAAPVGFDVTDYTDAVRRAHFITRWGTGDKEQLPRRLWLTNQQAVIYLVGVPALALLWYFTRSVNGKVMAPQLWWALIVVVCVAVAKAWHRKPFDGRTLPRTARSAGAHMAANRGRHTGRWLVHGRPVGNTRRRPKPPARPARVPYTEELPS